DFAAQAIALRAPDASAPYTVTLLLALATAITLAAMLRALVARGGAFPLVFGLMAVLVAPLAAVAQELFWQPAQVIGTYPWALHVMALAALMVMLAVKFASADGEDRRRAAYATLSALSLIALALFLIATKSALTLALAALVVTAAGLDRKFRLPEMGWFIQLGVAVLGWRLTVDPGFDWALTASLPQAILAFSGVIIAMVAAWYLLRPLDRPLPTGVLESAAFGFSALFANVLITRWLRADITDLNAVDWTQTHWGIVMNAMPWLVLMLVQLYRVQLGGLLRPLRFGIAVVAGAFAAGGVLLAAVGQNPLAAWGREDIQGLVYGPWLLDTLLLAYALPGLMLLAAALKMPWLDRRLRIGFAACGTALVVLYGVLEIRRFWQGDWLGIPGITQPELYSYTVALMLTGAALLYQAIARRSALLRRAAMAVIGLTVAKVFFIDAAGLTGLTRVFSFLGLGLSLAGLAWLNRWAASTSETGTSEK
ncbi:MAG: DUF2339 domain-containing protein, partial [Paracoccaceae bacterium]